MAGKITRGAETPVVLQGQLYPTANKLSVSSAAARADMQPLSTGMTSRLFKQIQKSTFAYLCTYEKSVILGFTSFAAVKIQPGM